MESGSNDRVLDDVVKNCPNETERLLLVFAADILYVVEAGNVRACS